MIGFSIPWKDMGEGTGGTSGGLVSYSQ